MPRVPKSPRSPQAPYHLDRDLATSRLKRKLRAASISPPKSRILAKYHQAANTGPSAGHLHDDKPQALVPRKRPRAPSPQTPSPARPPFKRTHLTLHEQSPGLTATPPPPRAFIPPNHHQSHQTGMSQPSSDLPAPALSATPFPHLSTSSSLRGPSVSCPPAIPSPLTSTLQAPPKLRKIVPIIPDYSFAHPLQLPTHCPLEECDDSISHPISATLQMLLSRYSSLTGGLKGKDRASDDRTYDQVMLEVSIHERIRIDARITEVVSNPSYPVDINFSALPSRIFAMYSDINIRITTSAIVQNCPIWRDILANASKHGISLNNITGLANLPDPMVDRLRPGYYGEKGSYIIEATILKLFPNAGDPAGRLRSMMFAKLYLVPYITTRLIADDLDCSFEDAWQTMLVSSSAGIRHRLEEEEDEIDMLVDAVFRSIAPTPPCLTSPPVGVVARPRPRPRARKLPTSNIPQEVCIQQPSSRGTCHGGQRLRKRSTNPKNAKLCRSAKVQDRHTIA